MAQVTIGYEEFDSIKKHEKELEKRVEELETENKELKNGRKVIIRKRILKRDEYGRIPFNIKNEDFYNKDTYVNFDDIRENIEETFRKEVEEEINKEREFYNKSAADYREKEKSLRGELEKEMQGKVAIADAKAKEAEDKYLRLRNYLHPVIHRLLSVNSDLEGKLFPPYKEIGALGNIIEDVKSVLKKEEIN